MNKFEINKSYGVLRLSDRKEVVTIAERGAKSVTFADGREVRILRGVAPDGTDEEVLRIAECGAVATGGVVRVCHEVAA